MTVPSLTRRIVARGLDIGVCAVLDAGLGWLIGFGYGWLAAGSALVLAYFAGSVALTGTTVGKRLIGMKVVGDGSAMPSLPAAVRREAFIVAGAIPFVGPIVALTLWVWFAWTIRNDSDGRGPHDRFAGTRVVEA